MMKEYIHYGNKSYDPEKFNEIKNRKSCIPKPIGGMWASAVDAQYGWKQWCENNDFRECNEDNSFKFTLSEDAKVLHIYNTKTLEDLPMQELEEWQISSITKTYYLDFEKLKEEYDAIELHLSEEEIDEDFNFMDGLYYALYGWDCDSILIMNPDIINVK